MGSPNLVPIPREDDMKGIIRAISKLASLRLNADSSPTFAELVISGTITADTILADTLTVASLTSDSLTLTDLTPSRLMFGDGSKVVDSVEDLTAWIAGTQDSIAVTDDADGSVTIDLAPNALALLHNHNGTFIESIDFIVSESGGTVTGSLEKTGGGELTQVFSDGFFNLDTDPALTVDLTAHVGTDSIPNVVYVYMLQSDKGTIAANTTGWPAVEHIKVADLIVQSAVTTGVEGVLGNRNHNDHAAGTDGQGHLSHMAERLRKEACHWESGVAISIKDAAGAELTTGNSSTAIELVTAVGVAYQLHDQAFAATDMYVNADDDAHVTNQPVADGGGFFATSDLVTDIVSIQDGTAIGVNKFFNLVVWGVQNKGGTASHIMVNLPSTQYNVEIQAVTDADGSSIYDIPFAFKGTGFLIARLTFKKTASNWEYVALEDLRGQGPSITAGVGVSTTDHSILTNLTADDHTQYHTDARAATWLGNNQSLVDHDAITNYVADQHIDWKAASDDFSTSGTGHFGGFVSMGLATPLYVLDIEGTAFPVFQSTRVTDGLFNVRSGFRLNSRSTGDMIDTFGGGLVFSIEDEAAVINNIGRISAERDGADDSGMLALGVWRAGSFEVALSVNGTTADFISQNITTSGSLSVANNALYVSSSTERVGMGTNDPLRLFHIKGISPAMLFEDTSGVTPDDEKKCQMQVATSVWELNARNDDLTPKIDNLFTASLKNGNIGFGTNNPKFGLSMENGSLGIKEAAAASTSVAGYGQLWVKNVGNGQLWFTDDAGNDTQIV